MASETSVQAARIDWRAEAAREDKAAARRVADPFLGRGPTRVILESKPGTQREFKTRDVVVRWRDQPVEVWQIFYRYQGADFPPNGYQLVQPITPEPDKTGPKG